MASLTSNHKATKPLKRKAGVRPLKRRGAAAVAESRFADERDSEEPESQSQELTPPIPAVPQSAPARPPAAAPAPQPQPQPQPRAHASRPSPQPLRSRSTSASPGPRPSGYQFRALLLEMDALVGFNSKKKLVNLHVANVDDLRALILRRFLSTMAETEAFDKDSFNIQYFDDDFSQYVDLHDLGDLKPVCKLQLVPTEFMASVSAQDPMSVPSAQPAPIVRAELSRASSLKKSRDRGTLIAKQNSAVSIEDIDQLRRQHSSSSITSQEGGEGGSDEPVEESQVDFNFDSWKAQLMIGIPVLKRSAKDGKRRCRVLYTDPSCRTLNWRAPRAAHEKDHFSLFRGMPVFSKNKDALLVSELQNVKAARSPGGLFFVRLVFDSRNVDIELKTEESFQMMSLGFSMLMHESRGVLARRGSGRTGGKAKAGIRRSQSAR